MTSRGNVWAWWGTHRSPACASPVNSIGSPKCLRRKGLRRHPNVCTDSWDVYLDRALYDGDVVTVGNRVPCLSSASGRLIAAYSGWPDARLRAQFERVRWQQPLQFKKWLRQVKLTRTRRHAIDEGDFRRGITSIAAGVFARDGSLSQTISINVVSAQLDTRRRAIFTDAVQRTSIEIAAALD